MKTNTSVSLGNYFAMFVEERIAQGRYKNASEVIRAGLRLLEEEERAEEAKLQALRAAIQEGLDSGIVENFDPDAFLAQMHAEWDAKGIK